MLQLSTALPESWQIPLDGYLSSQEYRDLQSTLDVVYTSHESVVLPPSEDVFKALELTSFEDVRVVIIGQDPYHRLGQAMGLSFSVPRGIKIPPSLRNIYRELYDDVGVIPAFHGDLTAWAEQGVLMLNAILTVEEGKAGSHRKLGWESMTDHIIQVISQYHQGVVFLLWGNFAKKKAVLIDHKKHQVLTAPHPSPLARGGFFGCKHFSATNKLLSNQGKPPIVWTLQ